MTYRQETKVTPKPTTFVSGKGVLNKPNSLTVETVETVETFDKRREFCTEKAQKVSTVKSSNIETVETRSKVSMVSTQELFGVETNSLFIKQYSILSSEFQRFQQFQRGLVGGVSQ